LKIEFSSPGTDRRIYTAFVASPYGLNHERVVVSHLDFFPEAVPVLIGGASVNLLSNLTDRFGALAMVTKVLFWPGEFFRLLNFFTASGNGACCESQCGYL